MDTPATWQQYEEEVFQHFRRQYPDAKIVQNALVSGRYSNVQRQVDVLVDGAVAGFHFRVVVDAKHRSRPIDVTDVEAFVGFCADIAAHKGVLIALRGFTPAAIARAHNDQTDIELDVLNFEDLKEFQAFVALPFSGSHGVVVSAPFGWVVDGTPWQGAVATLYQRGRSLEDAGLAREWMYINLWSKTPEVSSLAALLSLQDANLRGDCPNGRFEYCDGPTRQDAETKMRIFMDESYPTPEITGFAEFSEFILFCVMFTPEELLSRNRRKIEHVIGTARPVSVAFSKEA